MAETVGVKTMTIVSNTGTKRPVFVMYPTSDTVTKGLKNRWLTYDAVFGGALKAGDWPIVVFSHGWWEGAVSSMFLLYTLAQEGAIVLSCDYEDTSATNLWTGTGPDASFTITNQLSTVYTNKPWEVKATMDLAMACFGNGVRKLLMAGHSTGGWAAAYCSDARVSGTLMYSPSASGQVAGEYALAQGRKVIIYGATEGLIGGALETFVYDAVASPAHQKTVASAQHYDAVDRTRCNGAVSIAACLAGDARANEYANAAIDWLRVCNSNDATSLANLNAYARVK